MSEYATIEQVRVQGVMLPEDVDALEKRYPGLVSARVRTASAHIDSRLIKRYAAPFQTPYPDKVVEWACVIASYRLLIDVRGVNPSSPQHEGATARYVSVYGDGAGVKGEIVEAADAEQGLFELPLKQTTPGGVAAVNAGGPFGYAEAGPYAWTDRQRELAASEDR